MPATPTTTTRVGPWEVIRILDGLFEAPLDVLTHLDGDTATRHLRDTWPDPMFRVDVACFALRSPDETILVDAGTGPSWGPALGHAPRALREAGIAPGEIDRILLTHLHGDHALGLFDGEAALFPRAEMLVPRAELAHFTDPAARAAASEDEQHVFLIAERLVAFYGSRVRPIDPGPLHPSIETVLLPGHTAAHAGYLVRDSDAGLLLSGDMLQVVTPALDLGAGLIYDSDPAQASQTRRLWLDRLAQTGWTLAGAHLPGLHRVHALDDGQFRLAPSGDSPP